MSVLDFGTGGLDLAYEVMRGYDALVLVDVSRQGGEPGTLYVIEPDPAEIKPIEDGEVVSPHGMDPQTVLRFVKTVGGWPGKVVVVACEPAEVEEMGLELSPEVAAAVERAAELVARDGRRAAVRRGLRGAEPMHELSISSAIVDTALRHADGRRVTQVDVRVGALRQVVPESLDFYFEIVSRDTVCEGAALELELVGALAALRGLRPRVGPGAPSRSSGHEPLGPAGAADVPLPGVRAARAPRWSAADELEVESIEVERPIEEEQCTAPR